MKQLLLCLALCFALVAGANAQLTTEKGSKSDQINIKIHEVDLLLQILPLLLTKDQLNNDVLPALETVRNLEKKQLKLEDEALQNMEPDLDKALKDAYEKGAYPSKAIIGEVSKQTKDLGMKRLVVQLNMVSVMTAILEKTLNAGQKKALENSFDEKFIDPSAKAGTLSQEAKINFFVKRVFLDPLTYEILKKLAAK